MEMGAAGLGIGGTPTGLQNGVLQPGWRGSYKNASASPKEYSQSPIKRNQPSAMRSSSSSSSALLLLLFLSLFLIKFSQAHADAASRRALIPGGWSPIKNLSDPDVVAIANFAVSEHNKLLASSKKPLLGLSRIVKGKQQVVAGMNYKLVIEASDGKRYEVTVWEKVWEHVRKLTSFKLVKK